MLGIPPFRFLQAVTMATLFAIGAVSASATIIISYSGSSILTGGSGFVDVLISSDAAFATPDLLDSFSGHFLIAPVGGAVSNGLQFVGVQADSQLNNGLYVFNTDSLGETFGGPLGTVSTLTNANDTYVGGDGTFSGAGFPLSIATGTQLLFRLNLSAALANPADQYTVSLINDGFTGFLDPSFAPLPVEPSSFDPFTITASGAAAIPEPATGGILLLTCLATAIRRRRKTPRPAV